MLKIIINTHGNAPKAFGVEHQNLSRSIAGGSPDRHRGRHLTDKNKKIIKKEEAKISKAKEDLNDIYDAYSQVGKNSKDKFEKDARFSAEKQLEKKMFRELDEDFDDTFANFAKMAKIDSKTQRAGLLQNIADSINGRFHSDAQFKSLIKIANDNLVALGVPKMTKKEVELVLASTTQGETLKLKAKIYAEHKKRPRRELLNAVKLMGQSKSEREKALSRIQEIESMTSIDSETAAELDLLYLVGLDNASIEDIRAASDIVDAVVAGNRSRVALEVALAKNRTNVEVGSTFLESVLGQKPNSDGSFTIVNRDGSRSNMRVFDIRKEYKAGDRVEHLGRIFKARHAVEMMTPFSVKNFEFEYAINVEKTSATKAQRGRINLWLDKLRDFSIRSHGLESLVAKMSEADKDKAFMESKANIMIGEEGFRKAQMSLDKNFNASVQKLNDIAKRVFGLKTFDEVNKKLADARYKITKLKYNDNNGNEVTVDFTIAELMTYYAYFRQPDLAGRFERMKEQTVNPEDKRFWNDSKMNAILNTIPSEYKALVEGVSNDLMKDIYEDLNKAYRRINGIDLVRVDNYFPVSSDIKGTATSEIDLEIRDVSSMIQSVSNHSLKARKSSTSPLVPVDFISTTLRYANRAYHYSAYVEPMRKASKMLQQGEYRRYLENKFGKNMMGVIDHHLNNIAGNGAVNYQRNELVDMLRSGTIMGALSVNLTMIPKQLSSFAAYANSMPSAKWAGYYAGIPVNPVGFIRDVKSIMNTDFMKSRLQSGTASSPDVMNLMLGNVEKEVAKSDNSKVFSRIMDNIIRAAYWPIKAGDAMAIALGGAPLWRHSYNEGLKRFNGNKIKAQEFAELKIAQSTSRTQQSSNMLDQSYWQTSSSWASMFTTFMSTPILYGRILNGGVKDIIRGSSAKVKKDGIKKVFIFGLLLPYLFQAASSASFGLGDDDEDDDGGEQRLPRHRDVGDPEQESHDGREREDHDDVVHRHLHQRVGGVAPGELRPRARNGAGGRGVHRRRTQGAPLLRAADPHGGIPEQAGRQQAGLPRRGEDRRDLHERAEQETRKGVRRVHGRRREPDALRRRRARPVCDRRSRAVGRVASARRHGSAARRECMVRERTRRLMTVTGLELSEEPTVNVGMLKSLTTTSHESRSSSACMAAAVSTRACCSSRRSHAV